jgi:hypothetical protein
MLIITIVSCQIKAGNSKSQPNNKKYGEKDEKKVCQLNLYPIVSHGSCKSQSQVWPLWRPYFRKPYFTMYTICSTVATLALGSRPRQGLAKVRAKREARESHFMLPGVQKSVRESTLTLPRELPFLEL